MLLVTDHKAKQSKAGLLEMTQRPLAGAQCFSFRRLAVFSVH